MLQLFLKTIIISIISCVLVSHDLVAFAADTQGVAQRNSDGTYSKTNTYELKEAKADGDGPTNILMMLVLGALATKMLMYKKWSYDMMAAAAGGAAYIVGEILNIATAKKDLEKLSVSMTLKSDGQVDSKQVEYIKTLKESYQKVLEALNRKKTLLKVAMAGFLVAAGIAAYQKIMITMAHTSCSNAIVASGAKLTAAAAACAKLVTGAAECGREVAACEAQITKGGIDFTKLWTNSMTPWKASLAHIAEDTPLFTTFQTEILKPCIAPTSPETVAISGAIVTACTPFSVQFTDYAAFGHFTKTAQTKSFSNGMLFTDNSKSQMVIPAEKTLTLRSTLKKALGALFENAHAGYISLLGLGAGAAAAYFISDQYLGQYIDTLLYAPGMRIAVWGVFTGICMLAISDTEQKEKDVEDNIKKIDGILNETSRLTKGITASNANITTVQIASDKFPNTDVTLSTTDKTGCLAGQTTNGCNSVSTGLAGTNLGISDLPTGLQTMTTQLTKVADGLSGKGTISAATMGSAQSIGRNANAISKLNKQMQNKLNEVLKNNGQKPMNFDKDASDVKRVLSARMNEALKSKGMTSGSLLASIGMTPTQAANSPVETMAKIDGKKLGAKSAPVGSGKIGDKLPDFKFGDEAAPAETLANGMKEGSANDKYDIKENDINADTGASIFELISTRYQKSGYPKLLEEEVEKK